MARSSDPNSASTEFSIMLADNSKWLSPDGSDQYGYAVFAQVIEGLDVIEEIIKLPIHSSNGLKMLETPVTILKAYLKLLKR